MLSWGRGRYSTQILIAPFTRVACNTMCKAGQGKLAWGVGIAAATTRQHMQGAAVAAHCRCACGDLQGASLSPGAEGCQYTTCVQHGASAAVHVNIGSGGQGMSAKLRQPGSAAGSMQIVMYGGTAAIITSSQVLAGAQGKQPGAVSASMQEHGAGNAAELGQPGTGPRTMQVMSRQATTAHVMTLVVKIMVS